jgi:serine/threonine protein kinase
MLPSVSEVISKIQNAGLMTANATTEYISSLPDHRQPCDGQQLLDELAADNRLTPFQVDHLLADNPEPLVLGNYTLLDKLGQGGMGVVYKALHRRMDRIVALKVLAPDAVKTPILVERFHREVKAVARLHHPNIVTAFDADEHRGIHFLVMELVEGRDLSKVVQLRHPLPIADALNYAHQRSCPSRH